MGFNSGFKGLNIEHWWNAIDNRKLKLQGKICPDTTLSATNSMWTRLISNWGLRGKDQRLKTRNLTKITDVVCVETFNY